MEVLMLFAIMFLIGYICGVAWCTRKLQERR